MLCSLICASGSVLGDGGGCVYLFIYSPGDGNEMVVLVCLFYLHPAFSFFLRRFFFWGGGGWVDFSSQKIKRLQHIWAARRNVREERCLYFKKVKWTLWNIAVSFACIVFFFSPLPPSPNVLGSRIKKNEQIINQSWLAIFFIFPSPLMSIFDKCRNQFQETEERENKRTRQEKQLQGGVGSE